jgi:hypothetical protein
MSESWKVNELKGKSRKVGESKSWRVEVRVKSKSLKILQLKSRRIRKSESQSILEPYIQGGVRKSDSVKVGEFEQSVSQRVLDSDSPES